VSAAAYVATAPVLAYHFGRLAPVGLVANLAAVPLSTVVLVTALGSAALADLPLVSGFIGLTCTWTARGLWSVAEAAAAWDAGSFAVARPGLPTMLAAYLALAVAQGCRGLARARLLARGASAAAALLLALVHTGPVPPRPWSDEAVLLDVGQGLALALRGAGGGTALIDAGGSPHPSFDPGERVVVPQLLRWGRHLDVLVVSHDHLDHMGGAFAVLRSLDVGELWLGPGSSASDRLAALAALARSRGTAVVLAVPGPVRDARGLALEVLAPVGGRRAPAGNDGSLVLRAGRAPRRILLPGDLARHGERALVAGDVALRAEALVVGHHGSNGSSSREFLEAVDPDWALVSVGFDNRFGHPHAEVVARAERVGARVLRTDFVGRIHLRGGVAGWEVASWR
jgi:competence protein ComEC